MGIFLFNLTILNDLIALLVESLKELRTTERNDHLDIKMKIL